MSQYEIQISRIIMQTFNCTESNALCRFYNGHLDYCDLITFCPTFFWCMKVCKPELLAESRLCFFRYLSLQYSLYLRPIFRYAPILLIIALRLEKEIEYFSILCSEEIETGRTERCYIALCQLVFVSESGS